MTKANRSFPCGNFYVTTPIYYVNDKPHIGHAYTSIVTDVFARFLALDGNNVKFTTGTDEHGQKILCSAEKNNISPKEFVDRNSNFFLSLMEALNINYSDFIRTTESRHKRAVQYLWQELEKKGFIYLGKYSGWYAERDEAFYAESEISEGKASTGAPVVWMEEESYFFKLSAFTEKLLDFYKENPEFIQPKGKFNEVVSFVKTGLKDLSVSRSNVTWGIPVPGNEKHTIYVWLDALTNYLSSTGYPDINGTQYKDFWQRANKSGKILHFIGKDILRFHAVYWPAFLMAAELPLPTQIMAHGWWTNNGEKISKSLGNIIDPLALIGQYDLDSLRYFLLKEMPFGNDGNFCEESFKKRVNAELANNIGNLVQRTLILIVNNCENSALKEAKLDELPAYAYEIFQKYKENIYQFKFQEALENIQEIGRKANEYIDLKAPWKLAKTNKTNNKGNKEDLAETNSTLNSILFNLAESIRVIGIMLQPFVPQAAAKILDALNIPSEARSFLYTKGNNEIALKLIKAPLPIFKKYL